MASKRDRRVAEPAEPRYRGGRDCTVQIAKIGNDYVTFAGFARGTQTLSFAKIQAGFAQLNVDTASE